MSLCRDGGHNVSFGVFSPGVDCGSLVSSGGSIQYQQANIARNFERMGVWILEFSTCMHLAQCAQNQDTRQRR